jgi:hypothetical protein
MSKLKTILFYYNLVFTLILIVIGIFTQIIFKAPNLLIILIPLIAYFICYLIINSKRFKTPKNQSFWIIVSLLLIFDFLATLILFLSTLSIAHSFPSFLISLLYLPFPLYFFLTIYHWTQKLKIAHPGTSKIAENKINSPKTGESVTSVDPHRRQFLKLLGGTSLSLIFLSLLNPKQAGAAFFGSVPGPGTVSLKDANGLKINPAEKQPTDGYKISQIDDTAYPYYYGYINQSGAWYIMSEDVLNNYRYTKGDSDFATNWTGRALLTYGYFDSIF